MGISMAPMLLDLLDMLVAPTLLQVTFSPDSSWTCLGPTCGTLWLLGYH